ncbi:MAG: FAD:protein FMN transferase [Chlamydiota bacterium]|nr:FAD:protein FMN transferase [Chlamydiota bacterium]
MSYKVIIGKNLDNQKRSEVNRIIDMTFEEVDKVYNNWNPESELSHLNNAKANVWIKLSPKLESLLLFTEKLVKATKGLYDPTVSPAHQLWKSSLCKGIVPSPEKIQSVAETVGWNNLIFKEGSVQKKHSLMSIDLGGIAKGYCVDLLVERLNLAGFNDVFVEWGGEIRASGRHPENRSWQIYISNLEDTDPLHAIDTVSLDNQSIATSGDYLQQWNIDGTIYTHVMNPITLKPIIVCDNNICSATVKAPSCAFADALATACMLFDSPEEASSWAKELQKDDPSIQFWFVQRK